MKGIIGAICGDIIGSTREFNPIKTKDFPLYQKGSRFTDDTVMTLAIANWLIKGKNSNQVLIDNVKYFGNRYPNICEVIANCGFDLHFPDNLYT